MDILVKRCVVIKCQKILSDDYPYSCCHKCLCGVRDELLRLKREKNLAYFDERNKLKFGRNIYEKEIN